MAGITNGMGEGKEGGVGAGRRLNRFWTVVVCAFVVAGLLLAINYIFNLRLLGFLQFPNAYLYSLIGVFTSLVFVLYPVSAKRSRDKVPWYDILLFLTTFSISTYFCTQAWNILHKGWELDAPVFAGVASFILCFLILEALRRSSGLVITILASFFFCYPAFADKMPGILQGSSFSLWSTGVYHTLGNSGIIGLVMQVFGDKVLVFVFFGAVLQYTGCGKFFLDLAFSFCGSQKGGPAKVAVIASGLFGSMSGDPISNVIVTGSVTIPAMKKGGYDPSFAGAVEAVASTGGTIMPPVMGATAFIMAGILNISYLQVCVAAAIPAILYYLGAFLQVHSYAEFHGLKGIPRSEIPSLIKTLREGWPYIFGIALLVFLLYLRREGQSPLGASAALLIIAMARKKTRLRFKDWVSLMVYSGTLLSSLGTLLAGLGFVIGTMDMTGLGISFSHEVIVLAGDNIPLLLVMGALASFILGTGITVSACYIFLAIVLAPALIRGGLNTIAAHMFVLYWGMASFITPPVALSAMTAAKLSGSTLMKTGMASCRLGMLVYLIPFFIAIEPALVLQGPLEGLPWVLATLLLGVILLAGALEKYVIGLGRLEEPHLRVLAGVSGLLLCIPGPRTDAIGFFLLLLLLLLMWVSRRRAKFILAKNNDGSSADDTEKGGDLA